MFDGTTFEIDPALSLLRDARAVIDRPFGWTQRSYSRRRPFGFIGYCAVGALTAAKLSGHYADRDVSRAHGLLGHQMGGPGSIPAWNDRPGRRKAEVLAAFDRAIVVALTKGKVHA